MIYFNHWDIFSLYNLEEVTKKFLGSVTIEIWPDWFFLFVDDLMMGLIEEDETHELFFSSPLSLSRISKLWTSMPFPRSSGVIL